MNRFDFLAAGTIASLAAHASAVAADVSAASNTAKAIAGISVPDSRLAQEAMQQARAAEDPQIFRHSLRSFVFAELIANARGIKRDRELVFVSAILHDLGLTTAHSTPGNRFEVDSASAARALLHAHGANAEATRIVWDAITLHSMYDLAEFKDPEVKLVSAGVITDVAGAFVRILNRPDVQALLTEVPRRGFNDAFLAQLSAYAKRKPDTVAGTFIECVAERTLPNYHAPNFYDSMKAADAFAAFDES
ncbi:MAG TPA: HD domain-containing protein [Candidatus Baltobacteraceae bacterium]|nr:HD domain-containing protein [Candidatus Baltobacteraceae bacterium]